MRLCDTFGEHTQMTIDMTKAYCDGFQTTRDSQDGWGKDSVNTMVKHFPGGGARENGLILIMQQDSGMSMQPRDLYRSIIYRRSKPQ